MTRIWARFATMTWRQAGWVVLGFACLGQLLAWQPWRLIYNFTVSEPLGLYAYHTLPATGFVPRLGQLVVFQYRAPAWALGHYAGNGALLLKGIGALAPEILKVAGRSVYACPSKAALEQAGACRLLGKALEQDSQGLPLPLPPFVSGAPIPAGYAYMRSVSVPNSYDSRYFGLVPLAALKGTAYPLLTRRL